MINNGGIEEVKNLLTMNLSLSLPIMKAHGVPEISKYLLGSINLEECISKGQQVTRNYVKRQITWWKSSKLNNINVINEFPSNFDSNFSVDLCCIMLPKLITLVAFCEIKSLMSVGKSMFDLIKLKISLYS